MNRLIRFLIGAGAPDERNALPIGKAIPNTVVPQHIHNYDAQPVGKLPVVRKCIGYVADQLLEAVPTITNKKGEIVAQGLDNMPAWVRQPSGEFVFEEWVSQAVWSAYVNGYVRNLATTRANSLTPLYMYIGTSGLITNTTGSGAYIYEDYIGYGADKTKIVADHISVRRRFALPGHPGALSEFEPARTLLNTALHAQDVVDKFFANNMHFDVIFTPEDEYVRNTAEEFITQLARRHAGTSRAYRPVVTTGKWKMTRMKDSNQANQMLELLGYLNTAIAAQVFGIDPLVFSLSTASFGTSTLTYQNASNLRSQVWLQACAPIARLVAGCISDYLPASQTFSFSAVDMLRGSPRDRGTLVANMALASKHYGQPLFTVNEMRSVLGYDPPDETLPDSFAVPEPTLQIDQGNYEDTESEQETEGV